MIEMYMFNPSVNQFESCLYFLQKKTHEFSLTSNFTYLQKWP